MSQNPKKRLEEILINWHEVDDYIAGTPNDDDYENLCNLILKEFVHKDSLPSVNEIGNSILTELKKQPEYVSGDNIYYNVCLDGDFDLKIIAETIRKLIEGK